MKEWFDSYGYRVCYEGGNAKTDKEIYELHKRCSCNECKNRHNWKCEPRNDATATTKDKSKIREVADFLDDWVCEDGTKWLKTTYFNF